MNRVAETIRTRLGARYLGGDRCSFRVWAPNHDDVAVLVTNGNQRRRVALESRDHGYFAATLENVPVGTRYRYVLSGELERPDPASRLQPEGVHGASEVVDSDFDWAHPAVTTGLEHYVIYEIHVGTFTPEGTFDAAIERLDDLVELGVTAVEVMPVAAFPGERNWGYDGVHPFAVQASYGGPDGLKRFVDACHARRLAVVLDVVYNHLGPEGNYLADFGPYFTDAYKTPWGAALNFDQPDSDGVREYFKQNALMWVDEFRIDALRLDAIHAILDRNAMPFLEELATAIHDYAETWHRVVYVIAETNRNDPRTVAPPDYGGLGHDAMWVDDLHHAIHAKLTGEQQGYYADYGTTGDIVRSLESGFALQGDFSRYRGRRHGRDPGELEPHRVVVCIQNHDQIGNRQDGDRLTELAGLRKHRLAVTAVILSPFTPLLFMGEEYGDPAPFPYFIAHGDPELVDAVRRGRRRQFSSFEWPGDPPDPADPETYRSAVLDWSLRNEHPHDGMLRLYKDLLELRRNTRRRLGFSRKRHEVSQHGDVVLLRRRDETGELEQLVVLNFGNGTSVPVPALPWHVALESGDGRYTEDPHEVHLDLEVLKLPAHTAAVLEF